MGSVSNQNDNDRVMRSSKTAALLRQFVEDWRELIEKDEPVPGSDGVDYVVDFWHRAVKVLGETNGRRRAARLGRTVPGSVRTRNSRTEGGRP